MSLRGCRPGRRRAASASPPARRDRALAIAVRSASSSTVRCGSGATRSAAVSGTYRVGVSTTRSTPTRMAASIAWPAALDASPPSRQSLRATPRCQPTASLGDGAAGADGCAGSAIRPVSTSATAPTRAIAANGGADGGESRHEKRRRAPRLRSAEWSGFRSAASVVAVNPGRLISVELAARVRARRLRWAVRHVDLPGRGGVQRDRAAG